jgi:vancomycin aglycone glucosyltransferase
MRVLLSTIGSRGDVQPLVALGLKLRELGQEVRLCVPPDFRSWIEGLGIEAIPIGPELRPTGKVSPFASPPAPEMRRQLIEGTIKTQFETIGSAALGCDVIVGATALQIAAPSIAERLGIPYVFAAYCPNVLPSPHHAPPVLGPVEDKAAAAPGNDELWENDRRRWNEMWGPLLNAQRATLGLPLVEDVRSHVHTTQPWLAADATLAPWPGGPGDAFQCGAWILRDDRPLSTELETFLTAGEPPVYFGFGSIRARDGLSRAMIASARAVGRRAILSQGWADLRLPDDGPDCIAIGEVNQQALFKRVAAAVHHGGAGTTTAAARAGVSQVVIPQHYDQPYWAQRVQRLGIGIAHAAGTPTLASLTHALGEALRCEVAERARAVATAVRSDGSEVAARRLMAIRGGS